MLGINTGRWISKGTRRIILCSVTVPHKEVASSARQVKWRMPFVDAEMYYLDGLQVELTGESGCLQGNYYSC